MRLASRFNTGSSHSANNFPFHLGIPGWDWISSKCSGGRRRSSLKYECARASFGESLADGSYVRKLSISASSEFFELRDEGKFGNTEANGRASAFLNSILFTSGRELKDWGSLKIVWDYFKGNLQAKLYHQVCLAIGIYSKLSLVHLDLRQKEYIYSILLDNQYFSSTVEG